MERVGTQFVVERMVLLLALLFCCLLDDESSVASEEWFLEYSPTPSSENDRQQCDGQACLLPIASPNPPAAPLPWGGGIRYGVDSGTCAFWLLPDANVQLLLELLPRAGPALCVEHPNDTWPRNRVASDALDVLAYSTFLMSAADPTLYPHAQGDVCVVIAREAPRTLTIAYAFTRCTWLLTAAALSAFVVALRVTGLRTADALLHTFRTFVMGDFPARSRGPLPNALSLLLSAFGVVMLTAFCAKFTSFLAVSSEPPQVQTLEEVDARVSVVYDAAHLQKQAAFFDADDVARRLLAKTVTFESVIEWEALMPLLRAQSGVAFLMSTTKFHMVHRYREWVDEATGRSLAHLVPKCVLAPAYLAFPVRRGWPHAARFSARVQAAVEAGLYLRYQWSAQFDLRKGGYFVPEVSGGPSSEPEALGFDALLQPLVVLVAGEALAAAAFLTESAVQRWRLRATRGMRQALYNARAQDGPTEGTPAPALNVS